MVIAVTDTSAAAKEAVHQAMAFPFDPPDVLHVARYPMVEVQKEGAFLDVASLQDQMVGAFP